MRKIQRLRYCLSEESSRRVRDLASFHLFFDARHSPATSDLYLWENILRRGYKPDCEEEVEVGSSSRQQEKDDDVGYEERLGLLYPVNVARNIAREMATTHFVFANDAELLPRLGRVRTLNFGLAFG